MRRCRCLCWGNFYTFAALPLQTIDCVSGFAAICLRKCRLNTSAALPLQHILTKHVRLCRCITRHIYRNFSMPQPLSQRRCRAALPHIAGPACFLPSAAQPLSQRRCRAALPHILHDLINSVLCLLQPFWFHGVGSRAASCLITNMFGSINQP